MKQEIKERVEKIRKGEVPEGYKEAKVGIIPEDWEVKKIENVSPLQRGFDLPSNELKNGDYPVVYSNGIVNYHCSYKVKAPGVVTGRSGTIGKVTFVEDDYWPHNTSLWVTNFKGNDQKFIYYLYLKIKLERFGAGSGVPTLNRNDVHSFKIPLPPLPEQEKIAEILSTWDKAIELKEKLIEEIKEFKKKLMQKLLTGETRFSAFTDEWETAIIKNIFEEVKRINGDNSKDIEILTISAKHGFLSQKDKFSKVIAGSSLKKYTHLFQNEFAYNKGNSKTAPFGCIFKLDIKEGLVPFVYICFRPTQMIDIDFFDFYFKHGLLDRQLKRIITSGARSDGLLNVSKDNFFNIKISLPLIEEQKKIGLVLRLIQTEIDYLIDELNQLKEQKRGLMQLLLTGIVRVEVD